MKYADYIIGVCSLITGVGLIFDIVSMDANSISSAFGCVFILLANLFLKKRGE